MRVRRWVNHFGPKIAAALRNHRPKPHTKRHLDEVYLKIDGRMVYLSRASEGEVLDVLVQSRRDKRAALKLMRKLSGEDIITSRNRALSDPAVNPRRNIDAGGISFALNDERLWLDQVPK
jgi:transposase-like protein